MLKNGYTSIKNQIKIILKFKKIGSTELSDIEKWVLYRGYNILTPTSSMQQKERLLSEYVRMSASTEVCMYIYVVANNSKIR